MNFDSSVREANISVPRASTDSREIDRTRAAIEEAGIAIDRLATSASERQERWSNLRQVLESIETWLSSVPVGTKIIDHIGKPPELRKVTALDALDEVRVKIADLAADAHEVRSAMRPSNEAKAAMREYVNGLAQAGVARADHFLDGLTATEWPSIGTHHIVHVDGKAGVVSVAMPDAISVLAFVARDAMIKALDEQIDLLAGDATALSSSDRERKLAEIAEEMLAAERVEEYLVSEVPEAMRRPNADVRAVLGIEIRE